MKIVDLIINGQFFVTKSDMSIIESCKFTGIKIPRFCYHESLSVSGNCRMCLVELESTEKLVLACLTNIESGFEILTNSLAVKKARENVLEILLLNHPLDCPICDQGGECDLQDQTKIYGNYFNKMFSKRRGVEDKNFGSLIKTIMTRCIHCTRCVRYSNEILGQEVLGTLNRGNFTEIGTYLSTNYNESNISGNVIDLCPVGALTSKSHAFQTRPWELRTLETVDLTDSLGTAIYVNFKETEMVRILPKLNLINGNIISNKTRFSYDALLNNRIYEKTKSSSSIWNELVLKYKKNEGKVKNLLVIINEQLDLKTINRFKILTNINKNIKLRSFSRFNEFQNSYIFSNDSLSIYNNEVNKSSILISCNLEIENEILNSKIRLKASNQNYFIYKTNHKYLSKSTDNFINLDINNIISFFEGKCFNLSKYILEKSPNIIIGEALKKRFLNTNYFVSYLKNINNNVSNNIVSLSCNSESNLFLGIKSINSKDLSLADFIFLINLNENTFLKKSLFKNNKEKFWFNSYFNESLEKKDYLIPFFSNFEKSGIYINLEQSFQKTQRIINPVSNLNSLDSFIESNLKKKENFKYLDFIKEVLSSQNEVIIKNKFSKSLLKNFASEVSFIKTHPIKMFFQDIIKTNNFIKNSYNLINYSLNQRYNSF